MPERSQIPVLAVAIVALLISLIILPQGASAWLLNTANANIARAVSLPRDAPDRSPALAEADLQLERARQFADLTRLPLAQARASLARGEPQRALDALAGAHASLHADFIAQSIWADAAWQAQQPETAFAHWRAAGAIDYFMNQAYRAMDAHQWRDAENFARVAVGIAPERADARYVLGDARSRQNVNDAEALREIARAVELARDDAELRATILSRQGEIFASQGKLQDALELFSRARQAAPLDARPRTGYALTLLQLRPEAREEAVALLTQVVGDSPWYTAAYVALAQIAEASGDAQGAEAWLRQGLARNPNDARLLFPLGEFYARQGRRGEAKTTLTLALKHETHADDRQAIERALAVLDTP